MIIVATEDTLRRTGHQGWRRWLAGAVVSLVAARGQSIRPQDDLFHYANGEWLKTTAIPADRVTYGTFAELSDKTEADLKAIVDEVLARPSRPAGSVWQQIADLYLSATDDARIESLGAKPLGPELARIDAVRTVSDLAAECGRLSSIGVAGPFAGVASADPGRPGVAVARITPGGTLLPGLPYYVDRDTRLAGAREKYEAYLAHIFALVSRASPRDAAREVLALETEIARIQWRDSAAAGPDEGRFTLRQLGAEMPGFDWTAWAQPQGLDRAAAIVLARPLFFKEFAALVTHVPMHVWQNWLVARYVTAAAPFLSSPFDTARFDFFGGVLTGQELPRVRWKRGVSLVSAYLGDALGRVYVERHFPPASRARAQRLVNGVLDAYRDALADAAWMTPAARRAARARLASMTVSVGYPDEWRRYDGFEIRRDDLFGNWLRSLAFESADRLHAAAGTWPQPPQTVNASYSPSRNAIFVPAAILQRPIFDADADDAVNDGAAGALVAHEVSHAFEEALAGFDAGPLLAQLRALEPAPGQHVNVEATARETAADVAGLSVAFRAYRASLKGRSAPLVDGLAGEQHFFLAWARMWRAVERDEYARSTLATSTYLPPALRANVAAANVDGFHEAFGVKAGDALFRPPASRVRVW